MDHQLARLLVGSTFKRINISEINGLIIVVPPRSEQDTIADHLDRTFEGTNCVIKTACQEIDLLREYRTRLIADVVTGKLDVREAAARLPDETNESEPLDAAEDFADDDDADLDNAAEEADA